MPAQKGPGGRRIVAGIDGSRSSVGVVRWAIRLAGLTRAAVDAVIAWHYPDLAAFADYGIAVWAIGPACDFRESAGADAYELTHRRPLPVRPGTLR